MALCKADTCVSLASPVKQKEGREQMEVEGTDLGLCSN